MSEKWEMLHFPLKINKHKKYISITVNCFANQNTTGGTEAREDKTKSMLLKKHVEYGYRLHNYQFKKLGVPKRTKKMSKCCIFFVSGLLQPTTSQLNCIYLSILVME